MPPYDPRLPVSGYCSCAVSAANAASLGPFNIRLDCTNENVVKIGLGEADDSMDYEALLAWVREHRI